MSKSASPDSITDERLKKIAQSLREGGEREYGDLICDEVFMKALDWVGGVAENLAETNNFVFGIPFDANGKRGQHVPTYEGAPDDKKVNASALRKARSAGCKLSSEFKYYVVTYTTLEGALQLTIVVEGWIRGIAYGISYLLDFKRDKTTRAYEPVGTALLNGKVPIDVFGAVKKAKSAPSQKAKP